MKQKTVLVTGGAGYIGSHTAWFLAKQGYKVVVLDTLYQQQPFLHQWCTFIQGDCGDAALLESIFTTYNVQAVMHFAAFLSVGDSVKNPLIYYDNNVARTRVLLEAMIKYNVLDIVFSSSAAVYGVPYQVPIKEDHPKNPINPYGTTKHMVELMLQDCAVAYGLNYVSLRYFNAAGALPDQMLYEWHVPETHLIPLLLQSVLTGKPFSIFGNDYDTPDGTCIRDYIHVQDLAQAHYLALLHLNHKQPSDVFNLGTGFGFSVQEIVNTVTQITGQTVELIYAKRRAGDPAVLVADPSKAHDILHWRAEHSDITTILQTAWLSERAIRAYFESKKESFLM